jgi:hypothetical protein
MKASDLLLIIDHNYETKPRPAHMNFDLMTAALQLERQNDQGN